MFSHERKNARPMSSGALGLQFVVAIATAGLAIGVATSAVGDETFIMTSGGLKVDTPPIQSLDCPQITAVLATIDATGYRDGSPTSIDPADAPLFAYESRLSVAQYESCDSASAGAGDGQFRNGFWTTLSQ